MANLTDYFAAEPPIIDRLKTISEFGGRVYSALSADDVIASGMPTPSAHLIFVGSSILDTKHGKRALAVEQQLWMVAVMTKNATDTRSNAAVRAQAGPLLASVDRKLMGFKPSGAIVAANEMASTLTATTPPESFQYLPGLGVFLRAYTLAFVNSSDQT